MTVEELKARLGAMRSPETAEPGLSDVDALRKKMIESALKPQSQEQTPAISDTGGHETTGQLLEAVLRNKGKVEMEERSHVDALRSRVPAPRSDIIGSI